MSGILTGAPMIGALSTGAGCPWNEVGLAPIGPDATGDGACPRCGSYVAGNLSMSADINLNTVTGGMPGFSRFDSLAAGSLVLEPLAGSFAVLGGMLTTTKGSFIGSE